MKIDKAMLLYRDNSEQAVVTEHPLDSRYKHLNMSFGACYSYWKNLSKRDKLLILLVEAWQGVIRDGVDPKALHKALYVIEEYRDILALDVPKPEDD